MAEFSLYAHQPKQRTYLQLDAGIVGNSLKQIADDRENAAKQQSAITLALAQMRDQMHNDEAGFMNDYINNIQNQIEGLAEEGDYRGAINSAIQMAGKTAADPALSGRIKANAEYKAFVDQTQARKDISQDVKDWAIALNPYHYEDKRDKNGNIIGGTSWKPNITPVSQIDFNDLLAKVKQMVFQENGGSTKVAFTDADGNETSNPQLGSFGVRYYKDGKWEGIKQEKLNSLLEAAIDNTPGARAAIAQDWQVANWQYDQMNDEDKAKAYDSMPHLFASNGRKYTFQEYYNNRFGKAVKAMSGMNYTSSIRYDSDYGEYMKLKRASAVGAGSGNDAVQSILNQLGTVKGSPAIVDGTTTVNKAFGALTDAVSNLESLYPWLRKDSKWIEAKANGNYNWLASKIAGSKHIMNGEDGDTARRLIRQLRSNASIYNSVAAAPNIDKDAVMFNASVMSGVDLPSNNRYSREFMNVYNSMLYDDTESLRYEFDNHADMIEFSRLIGLSLADKDKYSSGVSDGKEYIQLDKANPLNYRAITEYKDFANSRHGLINNFFSNIFSPRLPLSVSNSGKTKAIKEETEQGDVFSPTVGRTTVSSDNIAKLKGLIDVTNSKSTQNLGNIASNQIITETKFTALPEIQVAYDQYGNDIENAEKYKSAVDAARETYLTTYIPRIEGSQYEMAVYNPDKGTYETIDANKQSSLMEVIRTYASAKKNEVGLGTGIVDGKVGLSIEVPAVWNYTKNKYVEGDVTPQKIVIFGADIPPLTALQNDTKFLATVKYEKLSQIRGAKEIGFDNTAIQFDNSGRAVLITDDGVRIPVGKDDAIRHLDRYEAYNQCRDAFIEGNPNAVNMIYKFVQGAYGYKPGTPEFNNMVLNISQQITSEK